jgi:hypothetical protein
VREVFFTGLTYRQTLPAFPSTPSYNIPAAFGSFAGKKTMRLFSLSSGWLICSLHVIMLSDLKNSMILFFHRKNKWHYYILPACCQ